MLKVTRHIASQGYDRIRCWANPVALPYGNEVLVLAQKLTLKAIDCFSDVSLFRSTDSGNSWSNASLFPHLADTVLPDGKRIAYLVSAMRLMDDNTILVLATRHCYNADNTLDKETPRCVVYFYFDPEKASCTELRKLELPAPQDAHTLAVNTQFNFQNRKCLLPYSIWQNRTRRFSAGIAEIRREPDGTLTVIDSAVPLTTDDARGFLEPSLCLFDGKYYLTLRNDLSGYITCSSDWKNFPTPEKLNWSNGEWLGNCNTMTRLITIGNKLYLVYTRCGLNNDHVFRNRAPLLTAEVDTRTNSVKPETEQIVVPEYGARLGNFTAVTSGVNNAYISVAEWMQTLEPDWHECWKCEQYGADNRIWYIELKS